jgi:hypothetical protein
MSKHRRSPRPHRASAGRHRSSVSMVTRLSNYLVKEKAVMFTVMTAAIVLGVVGGASGPATMTATVEQGSPAHVVVTAGGHGQEITGAAVSAHVAGVAPGTQVAQSKFVGGWCVRISDDGVRVRSEPSSDGAVLGLAYRADLFRILQADVGSWTEGVVLRTGIHGYIAHELLGGLTTC